MLSATGLVRYRTARFKRLCLVSGVLCIALTAGAEEAGEKKDEEEIRNETGVRRRSIPAHHQKDSPGVHARAEEGGSSNLFASPI